MDESWKTIFFILNEEAKDILSEYLSKQTIVKDEYFVICGKDSCIFVLGCMYTKSHHVLYVSDNQDSYYKTLSKTIS